MTNPEIRISKSIFIRYTPEWILLLYVILFLTIKDPHATSDRVIASDGKGYYGFITAFIIYHDLDYSFIEDYEKKYYNEDLSFKKEFRIEIDGEILNRAFPGLAFLFLPFFLIGHLLTLLSGYPADGYSIIYQYCMGFGTLFYLWVGLRFLQKLLQGFSFSKGLSAAIVVIIAFGTNIIYYSLKESTMGHVYSFALISAFLLFTQHLISGFNRKWLIFSSLTLSLILAVRPTNGLIILLIPFMAGSLNRFLELLKQIATIRKNLIIIICCLSVFPLATMLIWYLHSGHWIVYAYGDEGFNFVKPQFFRILFSFHKGWFIYTPLALVSMAGFVQLYRSNRFRFFWAISFLVIFVYVASSWWIWHYTSNYGQRVFIDIYPLVGILLGYSWLLLKKIKIPEAAIVTMSVLLIGLNGLQFYQHYNFIFPPTHIDFRQYKDSFVRLVPAPRAIFPQELIVEKISLFNDFEKDYGWLNYASVSDSMAFHGKFSSQTGRANEYSVGLYEPLRPHLKTGFGWVKVSAWIFSDKKYSDARLVIDFESDRKSICYKPFYLQEYNRRNKWTYLEFAAKIPEIDLATAMLRVYFFNGNRDELFLVDDLNVEILSLEGEFEFY
nr:hypothetical protein [Bacteroidota bacterium]